MRVLVVEDDQPLVRIMTKSLESNGFEVTSAFDGEDGLRAARDDRPDAIVLDLQLPRLNGVDLCRRLRSEGNAVPILMLTARSTVPDRIGGLDAGADDYLVKPFSLGELAARLRALGRRGKTTPQVIEAGPLQLDTGAREARVNGSPVELTGTEFALLEYMLRSPNRPLSRATIMEHVWGIRFDPGTNVVDVFINALRNKLDPEHEILQTVRGVGYVAREPGAGA